jgi:uncharacterized protein (UPF0276 family)
VGLRDAHSRQIDEQRPDIGWLEAHSENLFGEDPRRHRRMERLRSQYPLSLHGVGLSLGSAEALDSGHLQQLAAVVRRYEPVLVSEHACWGGFGGRHSNQLLPLPLTAEAVSVLSAKISQTQDVLGRCIAIESIARYLEFTNAEMSEPEFLRQVQRRSGCQLLIDLSNLYINANNHGLDARAWLSAIPADAVVEFHLAGFDVCEGVLIDSHDHPIAQEVWQLYESALQIIGRRPTLIEWDAALPELDVLLGEMRKADSLLQPPPCGERQ